LTTLAERVNGMNYKSYASALMELLIRLVILVICKEQIKQIANFVR